MKALPAAPILPAVDVTLSIGVVTKLAEPLVMLLLAWRVTEVFPATLPARLSPPVFDVS